MSQDIDTGKHNTLPTLRYDSDMFLEEKEENKAINLNLQIKKHTIGNAHFDINLPFKKYFSLINS